jgi:hypothetical protein
MPYPRWWTACSTLSPRDTVPFPSTGEIRVRVR